MNKKGFSLIELIIYMAIVGLISTSLIYFSISISNSRNKSYAGQETQANIRIALNMINQKIHSATGVNTASSTFDSDPGILSLAISDVSKNPTVIDLDGDNGRLRITEGTSLPIFITSERVKVSNLVFSDITPAGKRENIKVEMTIEYNNTGGDNTFDYSKSLETSVSVRQ